MRSFVVVVEQDPSTGSICWLRSWLTSGARPGRRSLWGQLRGSFWEIDMKNEGLPPVTTYEDEFKRSIKRTAIVTIIAEIFLTYFLYSLKNTHIGYHNVPPTPVLLLGAGQVIGICVLTICRGVFVEDREARTAIRNGQVKLYNVQADCAPYYLSGGFFIFVSILLLILGIIQNYRNGHLWW
jgi:hypothetical protein